MYGKKKSKSGKWIPLAALGLLVCAGGVSLFMVMSVLAAPEDSMAEEQARVEQKIMAENRAEQVDDTQKVKAPILLPEQPSEPVEPVIIIDAGHGGEDNGCGFDNIMEKDINLEIAKLVKQKLKDLGYPVEMAREDDTYIAKEDRVEEANKNNALIYVSIHQNSCPDSNVKGIETWYDGEDTTRDSVRLAKLIHQETVKSTQAVERDMISDNSLCVVDKTQMPACLIETGFLSNAEERVLLQTKEYQEKIAEGIVSGINLYFHPKTMYLTFDDGPSAENTDLILDILKERNIKATFFIIGEYVRKHPETAKRIADEGHTIGIHCDVHDYAVLYQDKESFFEDFEKAYETIREVTGVEAKLFRFPGGSVNAYNKGVCQEIIEEMESRGFVYFDWNASLNDAVGSPEPQEMIANARYTAMDRQKVVMLAHDRVTNTVSCLNDLIDAFPEYQIKPLTTDVEPVQFERFWEKGT